jgi:hypothetical protein
MPRPLRFLADAREIATLRELTETARRAEAVGIDIGIRWAGSSPGGMYPGASRIKGPIGAGRR